MADFSGLGCDNVSVSQLEAIPTQTLYNINVEEDNIISGRFGEPLTETQRIPKKTQEATKWAHSIYKDWRRKHNFLPTTKKDKHWPIPALHDGELDALNYWLARFIYKVTGI